MNKYVVLETKGTMSQARQEIPKGEHFLGLILTKSTVLVYTTFKAPGVEPLSDYNIIGETFSNVEINQMTEKQAFLAVQNRLREMKGHFDRNISISNVIFNEDATIVFFSDGAKVVVVKQWDEDYDQEKAIAIACAKKMLRGYTKFREVLDEFPSDRS